MGDNTTKLGSMTQIAGREALRRFAMTRLSSLVSRLQLWLD